MTDIQRMFLSAEIFISEHCKTQEYCSECDVYDVCLNHLESTSGDFCFDSTPDLWAVERLGTEDA